MIPIDEKLRLVRNRRVQFKLDFNNYLDLIMYAEKDGVSVYQYCKNIIEKSLAKRNLERYKLRIYLNEKFKNSRKERKNLEEEKIEE